MPEITDLIASDTLSYILRLSILIMFLINLFQFLVLIFHKRYVESRNKKINKFKETYLQLLLQYYTVPKNELVKLRSGLQLQALCDVIIEMLENIYGEMEQAMRKLVDNTGIVNYYKEKARSRSWLKRCLAVEKLGFLKLIQTKPVLYEILKREKNKNIIARIVWALSHITEDKDLPAINKLLLNLPFGSSKFNEHIYTNIIKSFRARNEEERFVRFLTKIKEDDSLPVMFKRDIIEACGSENFYQAKNIIIEYFNHFNDVDEMKITCVRALGKLGGEDVCRIIKSCLVSDDWRVRAVAAKNAHLCSDEIIETLRGCLYDYNYYVRMNAATSLSKLGDRGLSVISEECESNDRFVRDTCGYVLKEVECHA